MQDCLLPILILIVLPSIAPFPADDVLFSATWARGPQKKRAGYVRLYYSYMVVTNSYTAGDNQLHDSTITPQQELAKTYYNKNIFT